MEKLQELYESTKLITFQVKSQYPYLQDKRGEGLFDTLIGAYLLNPLKNDYSVTDIANEHLGMLIPERSRLLEKLSLVGGREQKPEEFKEYAGYMSLIPFLAEPILEQKLKETQMSDLFYQIEMPLSYILYAMETKLYVNTVSVL